MEGQELHRQLPDHQSHAAAVVEEGLVALPLVLAERVVVALAEQPELPVHQQQRIQAGAAAGPDSSP